MADVTVSIPGYEGYYEVSSEGRVRGVYRMVPINGGQKLVRGTEIKPEIHPRDGHFRVKLRREGTCRKFQVHRLVLTVFHSDPPDVDSEACHKNGDPSDNRLSNLKWGTREDNIRDMVLHGAAPWQKVTECTNGHELMSDNLVPSALKKGLRRCLSCSRARGLLQRKGRGISKTEIKTVADEYYKKILGGLE